MNYRHIYHAGNFADVFKHWILTLILDKLIIKDNPLFMLDSHAALGFYDLSHPHAQKTQEYESGIARFLAAVPDADFQSFTDIVQKYRTSHKAYPGSGAVMYEYLRDHDRLILNELHPDDNEVLRNNFAGDRRIKISQNDGYMCLKALLPPKERRGLIFIDPPFEQTTEFANIISALQEGLKRFATGVYVIWFPIKDRKQIAKFYRDIHNLPIKAAISVELHANVDILPQLHSCGLAIINPPWKLSEQLNNGLPKLLSYLGLPKGEYKLVDL